MVDREVDRSVWVILRRSWDLCVRSWAALGAYVGGLGPLLGLMLVVLAALGAYVGSPWRPWAEKWSKPKREQGKWPEAEREQGGKRPKPPEAPFRPTHFFFRYASRAARPKI